MAEKQIIWSNRAKDQFKNVLDFYIEHHQSTSYSKKISRLLRDKIYKLQKFPDMGKLSSNGRTRMLILDHFQLLYNVNDQIEILAFWDSRQNPDKLNV